MGVRAGKLTDGAAPLQFQLGEVTFPPGAREDAGVDTTQRQVDDGGEVGIVATLPLLDGLVGKREGEDGAQRAGHARSGIGQ